MSPKQTKKELDKLEQEQTVRKLLDSQKTRLIPLKGGRK